MHIKIHSYTYNMGGGKGRSPCCDKSKVKKGPWSPAEDIRLVSFIQKHGHHNWRSLPRQSGLLRCGKSCRLRWINYLRPDIKRGNFTPQEEHSIIRLHATFGNKWSKIASQLPGRTDNEIKNVWNTHLKKRSMLMNKNETFLPTPSSKVSSHIPMSIEDTYHHQPLSPSSTVSCNTHDEVNLEIPSESEVEFWNMLEDIQLQPDPIGDHVPNGLIDVEYWVRLLEDEIGLVGESTTTVVNKQIHQNDQTGTMAKMDEEQTVVGNNLEMWSKISDEMSPLWPTSPMNYGF